MATFSPGLAYAFGTLARLSARPISILLRGETGTGKEVIASAIHELSRRRGDFIAVNCGALPATLLESELFGHQRGAFSGATADRRGLVRSADGGTLFLDEIGELPIGSQAAFLRVLQEHEVVPVGHDRPIAVDLRVIAATLRDLSGAIDAGRFRSDLYARIAGHVVELPALRERREDLGLVIPALCARIAGSHGSIRRSRPASISITRARCSVSTDWCGSSAPAGNSSMVSSNLPRLRRRRRAQAPAARGASSRAAPQVTRRRRAVRDLGRPLARPLRR